MDLNNIVCNRLDTEALGSWLIMPNNLPGHCPDFVYLISFEMNQQQTYMGKVGGLDGWDVCSYSILSLPLSVCSPNFVYLRSFEMKQQQTYKGHGCVLDGWDVCSYSILSLSLSLFAVPTLFTQDHLRWIDNKPKGSSRCVEWMRGALIFHSLSLSLCLSLPLYAVPTLFTWEHLRWIINKPIGLKLVCWMNKRYIHIRHNSLSLCAWWT